MLKRSLLVTLCIFFIGATPLPAFCEALDNEVKEQTEPYGPVVSNLDIIRILECMEKTGENENWLGWIMYYGMASCMAPGVEEPLYEGVPSIKEGSGISFYLDMPEEGLPYKNYLSENHFHYNPQMLDWLEIQFESILANPLLLAAGAKIYDQQRNVARSIVFAHQCLQMSSGIDAYADELHLALIQGEEEDYINGLFELCESYYDGTFDTITEFYTNRVWHSIWFWLRRGLDGSSDRLWSMLVKGMLAYDAEWFETRGMRYPTGNMRGPYEYLGSPDEEDWPDSEDDEDEDGYYDSEDDDYYPEDSEDSEDSDEEAL